MSDYTGSMVYRRWRSAIQHHGYGGLGWRWECQFYGLLGMFWLMSAGVTPKDRAGALGTCNDP